MRHLLRRRLWMAACVVTVLVLWALPASVRADDIDRDLLKKGMTLTDVVLTFGQPTQMEWVNMKGTPVLFLFYPTDKSDAVFRRDGRMFLPLGFITEGLAGWGKEFYGEVTSPQARSDK